MSSEQKATKKTPTIFGILKDYKLFITALVICSVMMNSLNLVLPKIIAAAIDAFTKGNTVVTAFAIQFGIVSIFVLIFTYLQSVFQVFASERVARDLRKTLSAKISEQSFLYIQEATPSKLLTNLTSDIDAVKTFVSQAVVSIISSILLIIGASFLLFAINWKLALAVLTILPLIGITFFLVFSRMRPLFKKSQEVIDWLNKVINESILGAALIRVLNSHGPEYQKFIAANTEAKNLGMKILGLFAAIIPIITLIGSLATVIILSLGGHFVVAGTMSLGNFTAFNSYVAILIFPILIIGFMTNVISRASASYARVYEVLGQHNVHQGGTYKATLKGDIEVNHISLEFNKKPILKDVSFTVGAHTKTAIIGPTAAGKTQLLNLLTGLTVPTSGTISFDGKVINDYDKKSLHEQIGFVFQDSIVFNMTLRENIAFSDTVTDVSLQKAIDTAELSDFVDALPEKLNTIVSERGTSLSGGQKQRLMLARALAVNPKILLLDDFTARVDTSTEKRILENISKNYPDLTLVSVTQKIASVEKYDEIIVLMEGEVIAKGHHEELMHTSPEYVQIFNSQKSTNNYELRTE